MAATGPGQNILFIFFYHFGYHCIHHFLSFILPSSFFKNHFRYHFFKHFLIIFISFSFFSFFFIFSFFYHVFFLFVSFFHFFKPFFYFFLSCFIIFAPSGANIFQKMENCNFPREFSFFSFLFYHFSSFLLPAVHKSSKKWKIAIFPECFFIFLIIFSFF